MKNILLKIACYSVAPLLILPFVLFPYHTLIFLSITALGLLSWVLGEGLYGFFKTKIKG